MSGDTMTTYAELADVLDNLPLLVRETRRRRRLSLREAASEIGVAFSTIDRFERGHNCHLDHAKAMLRWIGEQP